MIGYYPDGIGHTGSKAGRRYSNTAMAKFISKSIDALAGEKALRPLAAEIGHDEANPMSRLETSRDDASV